MLVFVSDLHLKDGTSGTSITPDAFRIFAERLKDQAYRASWRFGDSVYKPITEIDLVLLGDVFDHIRSIKWLEDENGNPVSIRPWDDPLSPEFIQKVQQINADTLTHNAEIFVVLREMSTGQRVTLPPATSTGQPDLDSDEAIPVKVRIHYMTGNHDWMFYIPGESYNQLRQTVIDTLGLVNSADPFPYRPYESELLSEVFAQHHVFARHGDEFDPMNYDANRGRAASALGDALAVELLDRFPYDIQQQLGDELSPQFVEGLKELANVRPALVTPLWVGHLIDRHTTTPAQAEKIKETWNNLVKRFVRLDHVRSYDRMFKFDTVDALEAVLFLSKELPFETINKMLGRLGEKLWGNKVSIAKYALAEEAFKNRSAKYVVYGHTHFHEVVPLDSNIIRGETYNQYYMNSGTWHSYHDLTLKDPSEHKFVGTNVMTYLTFFKDDERKQHAFESWSGTLAVPGL
jgi:hypothetical protein